MIIVCPNCSAEYEVADQAIGESGRVVQCASCAQSWRAKQAPPKPKPVEVREVELADDSDDFARLLDDAMQEEGLDPIKREAQKKKTANEENGSEKNQDANQTEDEAALDREIESLDAGEAALDDEGDASGEGKSGKGAGKLEALGEDNAMESASYATRRRTRIDRMKRARRVAKRHRDIARGLPMARTRRMITTTCLALSAAILLGLFSFRVEVVRLYPEMASLYRLFGTNVNVVGLDFANVRTIRSWKDGHEVLNVTGDIQNVTSKIAYLPPIRVALVRDDETVIYEWNMTPGVSVLEAGGSFEFSTQLLSPPNDVRRVKLSFLDWQSGKARISNSE
ncbi:zinc-ribbon domain-containing protein [Maritalea sp. S77]|uniref:zinc-ribbon domain-containing protein n=1 Tax=Maritalea sp. S77 TaxID=3415125 RepID=UPI003C7B0E5E